MKKARKPSSATVDAHDIAPEYDFRAGVRGKYVRRAPAGGSLVALPPDLASAFPTERSVHKALGEYRAARVRDLIAQLQRKPSRERQKTIRAQLRRLGHRGGLRTA
jgi:hypothetical protein